jgi:hypothetical protein
MLAKELDERVAKANHGDRIVLYDGPFGNWMRNALGEVFIGFEEGREESAKATVIRADGTRVFNGPCQEWKPTDDGGVVVRVDKTFTKHAPGAEAKRLCEAPTGWWVKNDRTSWQPHPRGVAMWVETNVTGETLRCVLNGSNDALPLVCRTTPASWQMSHKGLVVQNGDVLSGHAQVVREDGTILFRGQLDEWLCVGDDVAVRHGETFSVNGEKRCSIGKDFGASKQRWAFCGGSIVVMNEQREWLIDGKTPFYAGALHAFGSHRHGLVIMTQDSGSPQRMSIALHVVRVAPPEPAFDPDATVCEEE